MIASSQGVSIGKQVVPVISSKMSPSVLESTKTESCSLDKDQVMPGHIRIQLLGFALFALLCGCQKSPPVPPPVPVPQSAPTAVQPPMNTGVPANPAPATVQQPQTPAATAPKDAAPGERSIRAQGRWQIPFAFAHLPTPLPILEVNLSVQGREANDFLSVGNVRINQAEAGDRRLRAHLAEMSKIANGFTPVDRVNFLGNRIDGASMTLAFKYPGNPIERVTRLTGQFDVVVAGQVQDYSGIKLSELANLAANDAKLKAIGLMVATQKPSFSDDIEYVLQTGSSGVIAKLKLLDAAGQESYGGINSEYYSTGGCRVVVRSSDQETNPRTISFSLYTDLTTSTIPFELSDISVEALKTVPPPERVQTILVVASETNSTLPDGLTFDARFDWSTTSINKKKPELVASIELSGPSVREFERLESTMVTKATASNTELEWIQSDNRSLPSRVKLGPFVSIRNGRPVESDLYFEHPKQPAQACQELTGELTVLKVEERQTLSIGDFAKSDEGTLQHPGLDQIGIKMQYKVKKGESADDKTELQIMVSTNDWTHLGNVDLIGPAGPVSTFLNRRNGEQGSYSFQIAPETLGQVTLEVEIFTKVTQEKFPFRFLNVPIPPVPAD